MWYDQSFRRRDRHRYRLQHIHLIPITVRTLAKAVQSIKFDFQSNSLSLFRLHVGRDNNHKDAGNIEYNVSWRLLELSRCEMSKFWFFCFFFVFQEKSFYSDCGDLDYTNNGFESSGLLDQSSNSLSNDLTSNSLPIEDQTNDMNQSYNNYVSINRALRMWTSFSKFQIVFYWAFVGT